MDSTSVVSKSNVKPFFRAEQVKEERISPHTKIVYSTKPDEFVKEEGISTRTKIAIGTGTLALIGLGILAFFRGRGAKGLKNAQRAAEQAAQNLTDNTGKKAAGAVAEHTNSIAESQANKAIQNVIEGAEKTIDKTSGKVNRDAQSFSAETGNAVINKGDDIIKPSIETPQVKPSNVGQTVEQTATAVQKTTKKSAEEIKAKLSEKAYYWEISPDAVDEKTAEILSKHLPEDIRFVEADIFAKSLIKEVAEVTDVKEKAALLEKAIELLPKGSYNNEKYSDALRKEILENILQITKDPKTSEAQRIIKALGESIKKDDSVFESLLKKAPEEFDFYSYSKIKEIVPKEELSELTWRNEDLLMPFIQNNLFKSACQATTPKEKAYLMEKALNNFEKNPYCTSGWEWINRRYNVAANVPELRERVEKRICEHLNTLLPELETSKLSFETQKSMLKQIWEFKQGAGSITKAEKYMPYDKIKDILKTIAESKKPYGTKLSDSEITVLKDTAAKIAKKSGKAYENALENYYETGIFNIFAKKGDKSLNLEELIGNRYFTDEEEKIAWEYIECGDSTTGGAFEINNFLRNNSAQKIKEQLSLDKALAKEIKGLDKLTMDAEHAIPHDAVVFRAMGNAEVYDETGKLYNYIDEYRKVGNVITDKGYVSTTPSVGTYTNMFGGRPGSSYMMRIKLPKGTMGCNMQRCKVPYWGENQEFLLPRNSKFKVLEVDDKAKIIEVEYILPKK